MIDFPSLPTDSLYKFLALAGLLMMFTVIFLYTKLRAELYSKIYDVRCSQAENEAKITYFEKQERPNPEEVLALRVRVNVSRVNTEEVTRLSLELQLLGKLFLGLLLSGVILSGVGFGFWHQKIQTYQDALIKIKVEQVHENANQSVNRTPQP